MNLVFTLTLTDGGWTVVELPYIEDEREASILIAASYIPVWPLVGLRYAPSLDEGYKAPLYGVLYVPAFIDPVIFGKPASI